VAAEPEGRVSDEFGGRSAIRILTGADARDPSFRQHGRRDIQRRINKMSDIAKACSIKMLKERAIGVPPIMITPTIVLHIAARYLVCFAIAIQTIIFCGGTDG